MLSTGFQNSRRFLWTALLRAFTSCSSFIVFRSGSMSFTPKPMLLKKTVISLIELLAAASESSFITATPSSESWKTFMSGWTMPMVLTDSMWTAASRMEKCAGAQPPEKSRTAAIRKNLKELEDIVLSL